MYSFNFDYIFNAVYNGLLAIRYAILFWILRINPVDYVNDHKDDSYDGLIARGWLGDATNKAQAPSNDTIYLGSNSEYSWWDYIKEHLFGIKTHTTSLSDSYSTNYGLNPNDINFATQKVNNDPWWRDLHFSIQNPILAFCADVVSVIAFFALLAFIYSMLRWLFIVLASTFEKKEKAREEKYQARKIEREARIAKYQEERLRELENARAIPIPEYKPEYEQEIKNITEDFPAGIKGLPIDENDLSEEEKNIIKKDNDILKSYQFKNTIDPNKHKLIKIVKKEDLPLPKYESENNIKEISNLKAEREYAVQNPTNEEKIKEFRNKWNIVINYMEGSEEALWRIGILEADNLLSDILSDRGYQGLTISDKLKNAYFNTIDLAWSAHKMRNRIAHDGSNFILTDRMARNTLNLYKSVFTEFKIFE